MSKHTPGPWVRNEEAPKIVMSGSVIEGHQGYIIGSVTGNDNSGYFASEEEAEANARLIVTAPELLEMLSALECDINTMLYCYEKRPENFWYAMDTAKRNAERARAIIAKVRGES